MKINKLALLLLGVSFYCSGVVTKQSLGATAAQLQKEGAKALTRAQTAQSMQGIIAAQAQLDQAAYDALVLKKEGLMAEKSQATTSQQTAVVTTKLLELQNQFLDFYAMRVDMPFLEQWKYALYKKLKENNSSGGILTFYTNEVKAMKEGTASVVLPNHLYQRDYYACQRPLLHHIYKQVELMNNITSQRKKLEISIRNRLAEIINFKAGAPWENNRIATKLNLPTTLPSNRIVLLKLYMASIVPAMQGWFVTGREQAQRYLSNEVKELQNILSKYAIQDTEITEQCTKLKSMLNMLHVNIPSSPLMEKLKLTNKIPYEQWKLLEEYLITLLWNVDALTLKSINSVVTTAQALNLSLLKDADKVLTFWDKVIKQDKETPAISRKNK